MLELYSMDSCPYCVKVKDYLKAHNIEYTEHNVNDPEKAKQLLKLGGRAQVPFLADSEKNIYLYDSDAIIKYVKENC